MILNVLKQFNWLDIFILVLIFRICYIAAKMGFTTELFKFLGTIAAIFIPMHYSFSIAGYIIGSLPSGDKIPGSYIEAIVFVFLCICGYLIFVFLRNVFNNLVKMEAVSTLNKWGGLILGGIRSLFAVSLVSFALMATGNSYLENSVKHSYLGAKVPFVSVDTYEWIYSAVFSKFLPSEKEGGIVNKIKEDLA